MDNWQNEYENRKSLILNEWENLLEQNLSEHSYHTFLANNAGLFLTNDFCHLAISKLKFGSELETDFVTLTDGFSNGNIFELIEIKQPSAKLFTEKGVMTAEFNRASQQIRDWKRWLMDNRGWMRKHLPTVSTRIMTNSDIKFKIIIGRRLTNPYEIEKRNQIGQELGAEIRSFDYLTEKLRRRDHWFAAWLSGNNFEFEKQLSNPFFKAFNDSSWKTFCNSKKLSSSHFYSHHYQDILNIRNSSTIEQKL